MRPPAIAFQTGVAESNANIRSMYDDLHESIQIPQVTAKRPSFQDVMLPDNSIHLLDSGSIERKIAIVKDLNSSEWSKNIMGTRTWHGSERYEAEFGRFVWSVGKKTLPREQR